VGEPTDYLAEYTALIRYCQDEQRKTFRAGKMHAWRIHADLAWANGESVFDVCDAHSQELHEVYAALFDSQEDTLKEAVRTQFDCFDSNILVIDYVVLQPRWRGLKLGLLALRKLVDLLGGGCALVVSDIQPLNPDAYRLIKVPPSWLRRNESDEEGRLARGKLRHYFRTMGFRRIGRTKYFGLSLSHKVPTLGDLISPKHEPR
jgi:hypothetical protein